MSSHQFDRWDEEAKASAQAFEKQVLLDSSLVFNVFSTDSGKLLIDRWKEVLIYQPTASRGEDLVSIGMNEGYKAFIRSILNAIKTHEEQQ